MEVEGEFWSYNKLYADSHKHLDLFVAVNSPHNQSDYIPCITWDRLAQFTNNLEVGNRVEIIGRVQSRQYFKRYSPDSEEGEYRFVYEISVIRLQKMNTGKYRNNLTVEEIV